MRIRGGGYGGKLKKTTRTIRENNTMDAFFYQLIIGGHWRIIFAFIFQKMHADSGGGAATAAITLFLIFFAIILFFLKACKSHEFDIIYERRQLKGYDWR